MRRKFYGLITISIASQSFAQTSDTLQAAQHIQEVVITAYNSQKKYFETPAAAAVLPPKIISSHGQEQLVSTISALPGIQLEERSPGSYRLNLRGSSKRAPFGVRNVKVYYNGFPFTEPGGTTYLNQLSFYKFEAAEFLKGPSGSIYGAGTGGTLLLRDEPGYENTGQFSASYGSFNTYSTAAEANLAKKNFRMKATVYYDRSSGFREQSASEKSLFTITSRANFGSKNQILFTLLHGNLNYQTPGGLTFKEYSENPRMARPAAGSFPSAFTANASIHQRTSLAGLDFITNFTPQFSQETSLYGAYTKLINPAIRNYSDSDIPHFGIRAILKYKTSVSPNVHTAINGGLETQWGRNKALVYQNIFGQKGDLQQNSQINTHPYFFFLQNNWDVGGFLLEAAASLYFIDTNLLNRLQYSEQRFKTQGIISPRISISKEILNTFFAYATWSRGFSPATTDEIYPTGGTLNASLSPERGNNFEVGIRKKIFSNGLFELNGYYFKLNNTIVQRRDAGGGDFYLNAGETAQPGIEASYFQNFVINPLWKLDAVVGYNYQPYKYKTFQTASADFSGNQMPGVSRHKFSAGFFFRRENSWEFYGQYQYLDKMFLNDANTVSAPHYHLLNGGISKTFPVSDVMMNISINANNLLNEDYSLGYDINAAGGRYYNAAPKRNYTFRITVDF